MKPERIKKIFEIYQGALSRDPDQRSEYINEACADDPGIREKVASLLASRESASHLFEVPAWVAILDPPPDTPHPVSEGSRDDELPYDRLGDYRLLSKLGEGGMGVVYLAVQESINREVALKVIRAGRLGSLDAEKRFWREVDALSRLRHPHIVTIFDSGEDKRIRYLVMEKVPGQDLNDLLAEKIKKSEEVPTALALTWIKQVAGALDCVHCAGILHRDVKPSNIRIDPVGGAKLMDFGVARHMEMSRMTRTGDFFGTPGYASPEQVRVDPKGIDERTDVYALGVTLYEVLTGRVPFQGETPEQVFRQIVNKEPVPPRRLRPALSRDLETVILTAMEKDPARRYRTMSAFADDIDRLLKGEMISARPAGFVTRCLKRIKRNPLLSGAVGVAVLALAALLFSVPWYIHRITNEKEEAALAEKNTAVINEFLENMFASPDPYIEGRDVKVVDILDSAVKKIETAFPEQPEIEASLRFTIGKTYYRLGFYDEALKQHEIALDIRRRVLSPEDREIAISMNHLGLVKRKQGDYEEAERLYRDALDMQLAHLGREDPDTLTTMNNLANVLRSMARLSESESLYREVLDTRTRILGREHPDTLLSMSNITSIPLARGHYSEAEPMLREVFSLRERILGAEHPETLISKGNLAFSLWKQGRYDEAIPLYSEALASQRIVLGNEHSDTLTTMTALAGLMKDAKRYDEAAALCEEAIEIQTRLFGEEHSDTLWSMHIYAGVLRKLNKSEEAEKLSRRTLELRRKVLGADHPETLVTMNQLMHILVGRGALSEAERISREILASRRRDEDDNPQFLFTALFNVSRLLMMQKKFSEAEPLLREGTEADHGRLPKDSTIQWQLTLEYGACLTRLEKLPEAERVLKKAYEDLAARHGNNHPMTRASIKSLCELYSASGNEEESARWQEMLSNGKRK